MSKTVVRKNESLDDALRRFNVPCQKRVLYRNLVKREFYEKPSVKRKEKNLKAARKNVKKILIFLLFLRIWSW